MFLIYSTSWDRCRSSDVHVIQPIMEAITFGTWIHALYIELYCLESSRSLQSNGLFRNRSCKRETFRAQGLRKRRTRQFVFQVCGCVCVCVCVGGVCVCVCVCVCFYVNSTGRAPDSWFQGCEFELRVGRMLCPWARHFTLACSSRPGCVNGYRLRLGR